MFGNYRTKLNENKTDDKLYLNNLNYNEELKKINKIIYNLDQYSNGYNFGYYFENNENKFNLLKGGNKKNVNDQVIITFKKYKKIKEFAKAAKNTVIKYRNLAQYYFDSYNTVLLYYNGLLQLMYKQKKILEDKLEEYEKLSKEYSNGKDKISLLETMINGIEKVVSKTTNLDLDIKNKINGKEFNISADAKLISDDKPIKILEDIIEISGGGSGTLTSIMYGGEMDLYEFTNKINQEIDNLNDYGKQLDLDNDFINKKVKSLHNRVEKIMGDTEELLNIRLSIEWMVNQLEKPNNVEEQEAVEAVDYQAIFDKLKSTIDDVKSKKINSEVAKYIRELEGMAKYFEDFITANKNTLSNIPEEQKKKMIETLKNIHGVSSNFLGNDVSQPAIISNEGEEKKDAEEGDGLIGGYKFNKYGGGLQDEYDSINKNITDSINEKYKNSTFKDNVVFIYDNNTNIDRMINENDAKDDMDIKQNKLYQIYVMSEELNKIFELFKKYLKTLEDVDFQEYWIKLFDNKNTDFYSKVKEYEIINILIETSNSKDIKANDFLSKIKEIEKNITVYKFYINYSIDTLDNIINKLNRTIIFYHIFVFLLVDIKFFYLTFETEPVEGFDLSKVKSLIELYENNTKSNTFYKFNEYFKYLKKEEETKTVEEESKTEDKIEEDKVKKKTVEEESKTNQIVGGVGEEQISSIYNVLTDKLIEKIKNPDINKNVLMDLYGKFNVSFSKIIAKSNEVEDIKKFTGEIYKDVGKTIIKEDKILTKSMKDLVQKISNILGKEVPSIEYIQKEELEKMNVKTIIDLLEEKNNKEQTNIQEQSNVAEQGNTQEQSNKKGGAYDKPRVAPYKQALEKCLQDLTPLYTNASKIERYIDKKAIPEENYGENTQAFTRLYSVLEDNLNKGTNSYINVNPMIFFTIEFPPSRYSKDKCKFNFTFKNQQIKYNPPNKSCIEKLNIEYNLNIEDKSIDLQTNQAFLKSVGNNTTLDLMTDRIIGLNKLIDAKPSLNSNIPTPTQKVINLMFALGASGTGKTTRYFGFSGATDSGDREGIVPGIVKKAKRTGNGTNVEVEMGYFVCYGRKVDISFNSNTNNQFIDNPNNQYNELVIFVNINKVNDKMKTTVLNGEFDNEDFYIFNESKNNPSDNSTYTNFYTNIVSKKLQRINYDSIKDYITNNGEFKPTNTEKFELCSFREIIQPINDSDINKYKDLWYKVNDNTDLSELFENLIKVQKCIRTVLPTKNNIESSRGHTCVLIKIIKTNDNGTKETQYFPLFDMAGTENINAMNDFFTQGKNKDKMNKLIGIISDLSKDDKINDNEIKNENKFFASLNDILKNKKVQQYVNSSSNPQAGGGIYNIDDNEKQIEQIASNSKYSSITGNNLIQKILGEGYYINHTIGMLIYIAKCIGCSINSSVIDGKDQFDNIENDVVSQLKNYLKFYNTNDEIEGLGETRILLDDINFNPIVNSSTIWIQVLLSFLYWNEENKQTFEEILSQCEQTTEDNEKSKVKYLAEQLDKNNINPEAPGNTQKFKLFNDDTIDTINPTYKEFFNNLYSIGENKVIDLDLRELNNKINQLNEIYPEEIKKKLDYTLKIDGDKLTFTNQIIEGYNDYINISDNLNKDEFYNILKKIIDENKNLKVLNISIRPNLKETIFNKIDNLKSKSCEEKVNDNNDKYYKCQMNLEELKEFYVELVNQNRTKAVKYYNKIIIEVLINIIETNLKIKSKYQKNEKNVYEFNDDVLIHTDEKLMEKLFVYDDNKTIVLNKIKEKIKDIDQTKAEKYKENKDSFESLITFKNDLLYNIAKNFNSDLYYSNEKLKLLKNNNKSNEDLNKIVEYYNKLFECYNKYKPNEKFQITTNSNQIQRIKDSRIGATKMVMMHVVTGQDYKYSMVKETIGLTNTLFEATQINLKDEESTNTRMIGGSKNYKINYDFIELIE